MSTELHDVAQREDGATDRPRIAHRYPRKWMANPHLGAQPGDRARCGWIKRGPHVGPAEAARLEECVVCADLRGTTA